MAGFGTVAMDPAAALARQQRLLLAGKYGDYGDDEAVVDLSDTQFALARRQMTNARATQQDRRCVCVPRACLAPCRWSVNQAWTWYVC